MNATANHQDAAAQLATAGATPAGCFTSITLWLADGYYLEVSYGYFDTFELAEAFSCREDLHLTEDLGALFLCTGETEHFVPDGALTIFRTHYGNGLRLAQMDLDDLLDVVDITTMKCVGIGTAPVERGRPIQARPFKAAPAANDE